MERVRTIEVEEGKTERLKDWGDNGQRYRCRSLRGMSLSVTLAKQGWRPLMASAGEFGRRTQK
jgi:hypothetical protein